MEQKKEIDFECRICGCTECSEVTKKDGVFDFGPGAHRSRMYCICKGCSVIFADPKKFSARQPDETRYK